MNSHTTNCPCCKTDLVPVTAEQILTYGSRWACPLCGHILDYANEQLAKPDISADGIKFWGLVGAGAFLVGLAMLLERVDRWG